MMMKIKAAINMRFYKYQKYIPFVFALFFIITTTGWAQRGDNLPVREYTNPDEIVTFDRTTSFSRALDVINEFAQEYRNKVILDRTGTEGNIGISVPAMHWMDALTLILRVKELQLIEQREFFEIVTPQSQLPQGQQTQASGGETTGTAGEQGEGPVATTQSLEVQINAIFFEGNRRALQELGVDWSTISENVPEEILGGGQGGQGGGQGGEGGGQIPSTFDDGPFVQVNSVGAQNVSQNVFDALINVGEIGNTGIEVQALFSAFEADNLGEILASPTVKVLDGQAGRIQVGQEFSIKQRDFAGNVIENFFDVGTILEVTPQVIEQNDTTFIHLDILAERSSAQPDPVSTVIQKQEATTQSLLLDGEATVIAGLYNTERTEVRRGVPILKDLPPWFFGLRYLFGYTSNDYQTRELIILLQASIEPSIPERISEGDLRNKYEILQDERNRMQEEIKDAERIMKGLDKEPEDIQAEEPDTTSQEEDMTARADQQETTEAEPDTSNMQAANQEEEQPQEEEPVITDPEVQTEEIQLDLGGEEQNEMAQEDNRESEEAADTQAQEMEDQQVTDETSNNIQDESSATPMYYIIGGSFRQKENAVDFRDKLEEEGYDPLIIDKTDSDMFFVTYRGYDDLGTAKSALADIRQYQNSDAWLYLVR